MNLASNIFSKKTLLYATLMLFLPGEQENNYVVC